MPLGLNSFFLNCGSVYYWPLNFKTDSNIIERLPKRHYSTVTDGTQHRFIKKSLRMAAEVFKQKINLTKQTKDLLIKRGSAGNAEGNLYILLVCSWEILITWSKTISGVMLWAVASYCTICKLSLKVVKKLWVMTIVANKTLPVFVTGLVWVSGEQRCLWVAQCRAGSEMAYSGSQVKDTVMA